MLASQAWRSEGLLPLCEALPARALARLCAAERGLRASIGLVWPALRAARAPALRGTPRDGLLRIHRLEQSLLYEEFGDKAWERRWAVDKSVTNEAAARWLAGDCGLELTGLGGRVLDLGRDFHPPRAAFSVAASAEAAEAAVGYLVLSDSHWHPCAWVYLEWHRDVVGAPGVACWVNDRQVALLEWPWPGVLEVGFDFDWAARELTEVHVGTGCALRGEGVDFHSADCRGIRYVSVSNRRGVSASARWETIQLRVERRVVVDPRRRTRPPFLEMLL
mmetsp:Transcript_1159/g.3637  ORF Transcript_1159/g.3637 Transcript_1159/m.3637 type:complete len:277 (+) Transcript_1159:60-890(+)